MAIGLTTAFMGVDNSVVESSILQHLYNEDITNILSATIGNPETINAGTARVFTGEMLQVSAYEQKGYESAAKIAATEIDITLDTQRSVRWSSETLDNTTFQSAAALEGLIAGSLSRSIMAERMAFLTDATYTAALALGNYIVDATAATGTTEQENRDTYFKFVDLGADIEEIFSNTEIGVNQEKIAILARPKVHTRLVRDTSKAAMEGSVRSGDLVRMNGLNIAKMPMFGNAIAAGQSFSADQSFDFTNIQGLVFATGAMAAPIANLQVSVSIDADGNPNAIAKYIINKGTALRPTLIKAVLAAEPTPEVIKAAFEKLKGQLSRSIKNEEYSTTTINAITEIHNAFIEKLEKQTKKGTPKPAKVEEPKKEEPTEESKEESKEG